MTLTDYVKKKGLTAQLVAQQMGVSPQRFYAIGVGNIPTLNTCKKIVSAMSELGATVTVVDLVENVDCFKVS